MKKMFIGVLLVLCVMVVPKTVCAADVASIGSDKFETLEQAVNVAKKGDTITILSDIVVESDSIAIEKDLTINLNGNDITAPRRTIRVNKGNVVITGEGTIKESTPYYAAITVKGSNVATDSNYTVLTIGKDVTLEGFYGMMITPYESSGVPYAYGVVINFNGNAVGKFDGSENGNGIYINGQIQHKTNYPVINVNSGSKITSTGGGIYAAGYAKWNITNSSIEGVESGIALKAGILNIDKTYVHATGNANNTPASNGNGINPSGAAIQVESNTGYAQDVELNITSATLESDKGTAILEYIASGTSTSINNIFIKGGSFKSNSSCNTLILSNDLLNKFTGFITGGEFNSNPKDYIKAGYSVSFNKTDSIYEVHEVIVPAGNKVVSGTITNGENAKVDLTQGGVILKSVIASDNGQYSINDVASGIYNIVATKDRHSIVKVVEVKNENVTNNMTLGTGSLIITTEKETANIVVGGLQESEGVNSKIEFEVGRIIEEENDNVQNSIMEKTANTLVKFMEFSIKVDNTLIDETSNVVEIIVPFNLDDKSNLEVIRYHNNVSNKFTKLNARSVSNFVDGTYYVDETNNLVFIYSNKFSVYGFTYKSNAVNPATGDNALLYTIFGIVSLASILVIKKKL